MAEQVQQKLIARANELINSKKDYIGEGINEGMDGYVVLSLIDEKNGYPVSSAVTLSKADGINWLSFIGDEESNKAKRIAKCNKACVCFASNEYNITLVGRIEKITDLEGKKQHWQEVFTKHYGGPENPEYCIWKFNTETYNIFFADKYNLDDDVEVRGTLKETEKKTAPNFEPILIYSNGQCAKAIELYKKAFGAEVTALHRYSEEDPKTVQYSEGEKDFIFNAQMKIGEQTILLCDDTTNNTKIGNHLQMVLEFDTDDGVKAAYNILAEGATDLLPPHDAGYSSCVAGLTDVYGIPWQLMVWHGY
ncbi:MAG: pyridoxamine 5'-phosphate oxidase family protein [Methanosarcinales archaeon]|nr:pyridoxamine 5'-phosphate oxidase family protein [Methanosarcinales archaeon]